MGLEGGRSTALEREQYERLLDAAETYREVLVIRLCAEVGLRPAELTRLSTADVDRVRADPPRYLLRVPPDDEGRGDRTAYLPTSVERELRRYARSNGLTDDDPIVSVTPRRLQMLVSEVGERASNLFGDPSLASVSTHDLRRFFASRSLVDRGINPRVVKAAGGWKSFEALEPYLPEPSDEEIVAAFDPVERESGNNTHAYASEAAIDGGERSVLVGDGRVLRSILAATDRFALLRLDADGYVERWNRGAASTFGYRAGEIVGTHVSALYANDDVEDGVPERVLADALEAGDVELDGWRIREDGSRFYATEVVSVLRDEGGRHRGFALLVADVSPFHDRYEDDRVERAQLETRYEVASRHRAVTDALLDATEHDQVETETCRALAEGDAYEFAWIDRTAVASSRSDWRASSGIDPTAVDRLLSAMTGDGDGDGGREGVGNGVGVDANAIVDGAADAALDDASISIVADVDADVTDDDRFVGHLARVPLRYGDTTYGTLWVATERDEAFSAGEREWLETIGRQVGYAIAAIRRRNLLLSDTLVELELECRDDGSFFVDASQRLGCRFELDSLVHVSASTQLYYVRLEGASPAEVFDLAESDEGIGDCRLIDTYEDGWRVEFVVEGSSPTLTLTEYGVTVREATFEEGVATITAECAVDADLRTIVGGLRSAFPHSDLLGKREVERSVQTAREFREGLEERLTDRQQAALRAAYFGGYYDWPRESTAEEVADAMGVSSPTLHNHLRKGQHELLRTFFDAPSIEE
ncbi:bacterio-opsin activator domain-containing protein [Natrialbaceae archaeon GCM10025810]|uniref:bacterio-opsin activator domain-containing protein n=1 Tax=Halovalidus salilacus TaxID=3075124 RepID=UPI0036234D70